jgi:A/G-specific adenine glycosylase
LPPKKYNDFQERIIAWYLHEGRVFYWRTHPLNTWQWLVLELLLKRTRAETVEKIIPSFITKYISPKVVIQTEELELENDLKYLGLYKQRQKSLKLIAEKILYEHGGQVPQNQASLVNLPFVGLYISNAVLCFGLGQRRPVVDSNIARVLGRFHDLDVPKDAREKWIWELAEKMLPDKNWREYNFGLIDLGATVCKSKTIECSSCCLKHLCNYAIKYSNKK